MDTKLNFKAIISGFKNYAFPSEAMEKLARERAKVCSKCEYANPEHPFKKMLPDDSIEIISGMGCNICGCFLSAKTRQLFSDCPEGKWGNPKKKKEISNN